MNILVIGLGKLGLPLAAVIANSGYTVLGYDKSTSLINSLNGNNFESSEPDLLNLLNKNRSRLRFISLISEKLLGNIDLIFVVVPTPSLPNGAFSNEYILRTLIEIGPYLRAKSSKTVICIVSTVMPGSCDGEIRTKLESAIGEPIGRSVGLCYHPEFIALGSVIKNLHFPDYHLLGISDSWVGEFVEGVFKATAQHQVNIEKMSLLEAEIVKLSVNNYITMKISFANSLYQLSQNFEGVNTKVIMNAIGMDSRIGKKYLASAAPFGGPCFPRDTRAMAKIFNDYGVMNSYPELTSKINQEYTRFLVGKILNRIKKTEAVGVLGVSYKMGTPVIDDSPGVLIAQALIENGIKVFTWDDEDAKIPNELVPVLDLNSILNRCDFFVITRDSSKLSEIYKYLGESGKNFIDLWKL